MYKKIFFYECYYKVLKNMTTQGWLMHFFKLLNVAKYQMVTAKRLDEKAVLILLHIQHLKNNSTKVLALLVLLRFQYNAMRFVCYTMSNWNEGLIDCVRYGMLWYFTKNASIKQKSYKYFKVKW